MMPVTNLAFLLPICVGLLVCATAVSSETKLDSHTEAALQAAINGDHRSAVNKARDKYRKPLETLAYFGFRSDMTVVEKTITPAEHPGLGTALCGLQIQPSAVVEYAGFGVAVALHRR